MTRFCRIWIPEFRLIAKPLYEATKGPDTEQYFGLGNKKRLLITSNRLSPKLLFWVSLIEKKKNYLVHSWKTWDSPEGVLIQKLGEVPQPMDYFSKLESMVWVWSGCLQSVTANAVLVEQANKLTFGEPLEVQNPHQVQEILDTKGHH